MRKLLLVLICLLTSCGKLLPTEPGLGGGGEPIDPTATFTRVQNEIFTPTCGAIGCHDRAIPRWSVLDQQIPIAGIAHNCGTARFGTDPQTSVLDVDCKTHDLDNLYVVDTSFFPSSSAVNPALTAMANALRVGDHLIERLGAHTMPRAEEEVMVP